MTTEDVDKSRADAPTSSRSGVRARIDALDRRFPRWRVMLILAVVVIGMNGLTVGKLQFVSVVDEQAWIDHMVRASKFELFQRGDVVDQETMREFCIRKSENRRFPCREDENGRLDPKKLGFEGRNLSGHSPFYFFATGPLARGLRALPIDLPPNDSMITWARLLGSVWLLFGLYFTLRAGELLGVRRVPLVFALLLVSAAPVLLHATTIVNPDVTALPAGAAVLWAALVWARDHTRRSLVLLAAASAVAVLLDETNGVAVIVALLYLAITALQGVDREERRRRTRQMLVLGATVFGAGVVAKYGWDVVEALLLDHVIGRNDIDELAERYASPFVVEGTPSILTFIGPNRIFGLFPPIIDATPPLVRTEPLYDGFGQAAFFLAAGALVGRTLWAKFADRMDTLAVTTTTALLVGGPLTAVYFYVTASVATRPTARFGLSALPAVALVVAATARGAIGRALLGFVSVGLTAAAVIVLF